MYRNRHKFMTGLVIILLAAIACNLPAMGGGDGSAAQTLEAINMQQTLDAALAGTQQALTVIAPTLAPTMPEVGAEPTDVPPAEPTATVVITHNITPGEPGWVTQWWMDTNTSGMASQKRAYGGEFLNQMLLERPFSAMDMNYRPDVDLVRVEITSDSNFFYFILEMSGVNPDGSLLAAHYGVEVDFDRDGRGDLLLWALGDGSSTWNIENVSVYRDTNNDVGDRRPILGDAPGYSGDGYEQVIFSPENLGDPDAAWKRVAPAKPNVIQLAIKKSLFDNRSTFLWNGWADAGVSDPAFFDYNDKFTLSEAGSPIYGVSDYPLKALYLVDNTCRLAYGFTPSGSEPGGCVVPAPTPTTPPVVEEPKPPCDCASFPNYTFMDTKECCTYCGYTWTGDLEFPCTAP